MYDFLFKNAKCNLPEDIGIGNFKNFTGTAIKFIEIVTANFSMSGKAHDFGNLSLSTKCQSHKFRPKLSISFLLMFFVEIVCKKVILRNNVKYHFFIENVTRKIATPAMFSVTSGPLANIG